MVTPGFEIFPPSEPTRRWAEAALTVARQISTDPAERARNLRHGDTWFVGVDALPNDAAGAIESLPLDGPWRAATGWTGDWHPAQLSIVYAGYPRRDPEESEANHRFRIRRFAAHVDGLLPEGPERRRYLREPHAFILGLPLNETAQAPLMVYPGSQAIMGAAFAPLRDSRNPEEVDLTDIYQAARRQVFETIAPQPVIAPPGAAILLHRHMLHGVAPWDMTLPGPREGRMVAYLRPQTTAANWLKEDAA